MRPSPQCVSWACQGCHEVSGDILVVSPLLQAEPPRQGAPEMSTASWARGTRHAISSG